MAPGSSLPHRSPTPCDCSWQGDPFHDEDPMRFRIKTGFGEDEFRAFHAVPRTRCVRHIGPVWSRSISDTDSSSVQSEEDTDDDEQGLRRLIAPGPEQQEQPSSHGPRPSTAAGMTSTPLARKRDPPAPRPHPSWLRGSSVSLSGLHRSFPSNEDLWSAGQRSRSNSVTGVGANHHQPHLHHQRPVIGHVRAQRTQRESEHCHTMRNGVQVAEAGTGHENTDRQGNEHEELEAAAEIVAHAYPQHLENDDFPDDANWRIIRRILGPSHERGRQLTRRNSDAPPGGNLRTALASNEADIGIDSEDSSSHTDFDDHQPGNFHFRNVMNGDDDLSRTREETEAQLRHLNQRAARLESRRGILDAAREGLEGRLRRLTLESGR